MNNFNNDAVPGGGFSAGKLIAVIIFITLGIVVGMMVFLKSDSENQRSAAPAAQQLFRPEDPAPAGYNPAARAESSNSGGSLEMLGETNAGLFEEEPAKEKDESVAENVPSAASPKSASTGSKRIAKKTQSKEIVIPRLQKSEGFGVFDKKKKTGGAQPVSMPGGGSMPANIEELIKTAPMPSPSGQ